MPPLECVACAGVRCGCGRWVCVFCGLQLSSWSPLGLVGLFGLSTPPLFLQRKTGGQGTTYNGHS